MGNYNHFGGYNMCNIAVALDLMVVVKDITHGKIQLKNKNLF
jgi:hypothetical protein